MKTRGLPCRHSHDCEVTFVPEDQSSLPSLLAAAAMRDEHERTVHDYRHVVTNFGAPDFSKGPAGRRGRPKKNAEEPTLV